MLLTKPREGKVSNIQSKEKIEAFQRKVLAAITKAGKVLNGSVVWQTRLSGLEESAAAVMINFAGPVAQPNPHRFYAKPVVKPSTAPRAGLLGTSASMARMAVVVAA